MLNKARTVLLSHSIAVKPISRTALPPWSSCEAIDVLVRIYTNDSPEYRYLLVYSILTFVDFAIAAEAEAEAKQLLCRASLLIWHSPRQVARRT